MPFPFSLYEEDPFASEDQVFDEEQIAEIDLLGNQYVHRPNPDIPDSPAGGIDPAYRERGMLDAPEFWDSTGMVGTGIGRPKMNEWDYSVGPAPWDETPRKFDYRDEHEIPPDINWRRNVSMTDEDELTMIAEAMGQEADPSGRDMDFFYNPRRPERPRWRTDPDARRYPPSDPNATGDDPVYDSRSESNVPDYYFQGRPDSPDLPSEEDLAWLRRNQGDNGLRDFATRFGWEQIFTKGTGRYPDDPLSDEYIAPNEHMPQGAPIPRPRMPHAEIDPNPMWPYRLLDQPRGTLSPQQQEQLDWMRENRHERIPYNLDHWGPIYPRDSIPFEREEDVFGRRFG
jgi:hypothetical protein